MLKSVVTFKGDIDYFIKFSLLVFLQGWPGFVHSSSSDHKFLDHPNYALHHTNMESNGTSQVT